MEPTPIPGSRFDQESVASHERRALITTSVAVGSVSNCCLSDELRVVLDERRLAATTIDH